ncbi:HNH endonuclease [Nostoc ellipsosporum NOK]|nr:HNH endonuclease [Nostoc ellipsosporum NOK]
MVGKIYIFARRNNKEKFIYLGLGKAKSVEDTSPVKIVWEIIRTILPEDLPEEVSQAHQYYEGAIKQISVNAYERNAQARQKCIERYGAKCYVCKFQFDKVYGRIGENFIHIHHLKPLSEIGQKYELNPIKDLRPVCPNCHAMLHRKKPPYEIEELQQIIESIKSVDS